jgi:sulfur relay (sulfurtransferase) DsrC/TusE family protein
VIVKSTSSNKDMSTFHPERTSGFTINWTLVNKTSETIKWTISKEKYKICHGLCTWFELHEIIPHCLMVMHKIDGQVGNHKNEKLQSYKQVLPRTLSIPLVGVWEQVVQEYNKANKGKDESLASFAKTLKAFITCHLTEDDQHELVSVIRYACKPDHMKVQPFFFRLKELNNYIHWLPGDEPALCTTQLGVL